MGLCGDLREQERYIRGSEGARVFLPTDSDHLHQQLEEILKTKANDVLNDYQNDYHIERFLEHFELLAKSIHRNDEYRVQFFTFLLRIALNVMSLKQLGKTKKVM